MKEKTTFLEKLNRVVSAAGNAILMNLMFLVACVPIVTIGQAWCGLMCAVRYNIRGDRWIDGFKKGYKTRFLRGTVAWIIGVIAFLYFMTDLNYAVKMQNTAGMVGSGLMCAFVAMLLHSALALNVYIYTNVSNWIKNIVNLMFKAPLQLLFSAALIWGLVVGLFVFFPTNGMVIWIIFELSLVFLCAYFALAAVLTTMALKGGLLSILLDCRADGLIIEEEGSMPVQEEEEDE